MTVKVMTKNTKQNSANLKGVQEGKNYVTEMQSNVNIKDHSSSKKNKKYTQLISLFLSGMYLYYLLLLKRTVKYFLVGSILYIIIIILCEVGIPVEDQREKIGSRLKEFAIYFGGFMLKVFGFIISISTLTVFTPSILASNNLVECLILLSISFIACYIILLIVINIIKKILCYFNKLKGKWKINNQNSNDYFSQIISSVSIIIGIIISLPQLIDLIKTIFRNTHL